MMSPSAAEERRRRRALVRAHHPDVGGDAETFIRLMAAFSASHSRAGTGAGPGDEVRFARRKRGLARVAAWYRKQQRRKRRGTPPRVL